MSILGERIRQFAYELGFELVAITTAEPFLKEERFLNSLNVPVPFAEEDISLRTHPRLVLKDAKSIVSVALSYNVKPPRGKQEGFRGVIARSGRGRDYHLVLGEKLEGLREYIVSQTGEEAMAFVDTGPLLDKAIAVRAGLGWQGKNTLVINPLYGSRIFLGEILTTAVLEPDLEVIEDQCLDCTVCVDACPTGALAEPYVLQTDRCLAYVNQSKEEVSEELGRLMGNRLYGCDVCQDVCQYNRKAIKVKRSDFEVSYGVARPLLKEILQSSNREFKEGVGRMTAGWRGKKIMQRNALLALGNLGMDEETAELVQDIAKNDPRAELRMYAKRIIRT